LLSMFALHPPACLAQRKEFCLNGQLENDRGRYRELLTIRPANECHFYYKNSRDAVEKSCHEDAKTQSTSKTERIQSSPSCLGAFVANDGFSSALLVVVQPDCHKVPKTLRKALPLLRCSVCRFKPDILCSFITFCMMIFLFGAFVSCAREAHEPLAQCLRG